MRQPRTNHYNYPPVIRKAIDAAQIEYEAEDRGWRTVTTLVGPPQIHTLLTAHAHEIPRDYSEDRFTFHGTSTHFMLERYGRLHPSDLIEHRARWVRGGREITGKFDRFDGNTEQLQDYKETSAWAVVDGPKPEWVAQLNLNALLLEKELGVKPKSLVIVAILWRDWDETRAKKGNYPKSDIVTLDVPVWGEESRLAYLDERIRLHAEAEAGNVPPCTKEERWESDPRYAVMKSRGAARATKLYNAPHEAYEHAERIGGVVEVRRGWPVRCLGTERLRRPYCPVCSVCPQLAKENKS